MPVRRSTPDRSKFNQSLSLPFNLRIDDFAMAMQDVYDFFHDVNTLLNEKGLGRLDDTLRPANMSGLLSDMLTASIATHSRSLTVNQFHNGHPDLIVKGVYPNNQIKAGDRGLRSRPLAKRGALWILTERDLNGSASGSTGSIRRPSPRTCDGP
jgi:hypothetical protein